MRKLKSVFNYAVSLSIQYAIMRFECIMNMYYIVVELNFN